MTTQELAIQQNNIRPANPFGEIAHAHQGSTVTVTEQSRAMVEALAPYHQAKQSPRNQQMAFQRIIDGCGRPTLAEKAIYAYPRGGSEISGPSIRLAEHIAQQWGNISFGIKELSRTAGSSEVMAFAVDLETNTSSTTIFQVPHVRGKKSGPELLTDERDIYELVANMGSRRKRACILAVVPGDIIAAATEACEQTLRASVEITPDLIRKIRERFAAVGVTDAMLVKRLGRPLDKLEAGNVLRLKSILNSITDGMATVEQHFDITIADSAAKPTTAASKVQAKAQKAQEQSSEPDLNATIQALRKPCGLATPESFATFLADRGIVEAKTMSDETKQSVIDALNELAEQKAFEASVAAEEAAEAERVRQNELDLSAQD